MNYSDLASKVLLQVPNCPLFQIEQALRDSAREFCERTDVWVQELDPLEVVAGIREYDLAPLPNTEINHVLEVLRDGKPLQNVGLRYIHMTSGTGRPIYYSQTDSDTLWLAPEPSEAETLQVFYSLKPGYASTSVPDVIAKENTETLVNGALWRLFRIADTPWYSMQTAESYYTLFKRELGNSIRKVRQGYNGAPLTVKPPEFV